MKTLPHTALPLVPEGRAPGDGSRPRTGPHPEDGASEDGASEDGAPEAPRPARPPNPDARDRPDLASDADVRAVLERFYAGLGRDPLLAPSFADVDLAAHLPRIADFWSTLLFRTARYDGNVFRPHLAMPGLTARHFARWLDALGVAVGASHAGPTADRLLDLAHRIAWSMQLRLGLAPGAPADEPSGDAALGNPRTGDAPPAPGSSP